MAKTDALSIYLANGSTLDKLQELYGGVIENVQKYALSQQLKNPNYSGDPRSGSVEYKRFANSTSKAYGTARANGYGDKVKNTSVIVNIDQRQEIVEEIEMIDVDLYGVEGMIARRQRDHIQTMSRVLDNAFFKEMITSATEITPTATTVQGKLEELIQSVESVSNTFVDGIDRSMLVVTVTPTIYSLLRDYLDTIYNTNLDTTKQEIQMFHGVRIFSNYRQTITEATEGEPNVWSADYLCMYDGSMGQPVRSYPYQPQRIELSNSIGVPLFYTYGVKAITPDLIKGINITLPTPPPPPLG